MSLTKTTILQRAFDLEVGLQGDRIILRRAGFSRPARSHALAILDVFAAPKSIERAIHELAHRVRGARDWIWLSNQIIAMAQAGFLCPPDQRAVDLPSHRGHFSSPNVHIRMLNDRARTSAYQQALKQLVRPTDVVVDIGTGTGILAASAALAGAKKVFAIERSGNMPKLATDFFRANGLGERITLIEGDSTRIELPVKADVLVSEIIGNDPLAEGILSTTADARKRLLNPGARLIPSRLTLYAQPVTAPDEVYRRSVFTPGQADQWRQWYGVDFSNYVLDSKARSFSTQINTHRMRQWPRLSRPIELIEIDLETQASEVIDLTRTARIETSGTLNAVILYFATHLAPDLDLSIHPDRAEPSNSWASWVWLPGAPRSLIAGQEIELTYRFGERCQSDIAIGVNMG